MSSPSTIRERYARWLFVAAAGVAAFSLGLPFFTDTFFARWGLLFLIGVSWLLAGASFLLKPSIAAGVMLLLGVLVVAVRQVVR
jgi:uncharacterized membrane protein HdeD (DUF308 family)